MSNRSKIEFGWWKRTRTLVAGDGHAPAARRAATNAAGLEFGVAIRTDARRCYLGREFRPASDPSFLHPCPSLMHDAHRGVRLRHIRRPQPKRGLIGHKDAGSIDGVHPKPDDRLGVRVAVICRIHGSGHGTSDVDDPSDQFSLAGMRHRFMASQELLGVEVVAVPENRDSFSPPHHRAAPS